MESESAHCEKVFSFQGARGEAALRTAADSVYYRQKPQDWNRQSRQTSTGVFVSQGQRENGVMLSRKAENRCAARAPAMTTDFRCCHMLS